MSDAVDKLSIQITSEADEAASAVERLVKNMRSLARIMKRLESGSTGIKGVAQSAKDIADGVSKSSDKTTSGMKKTTKEVNETRKAVEGLKKASSEIKVKADTKELWQAANDMAKARTMFPSADSGKKVAEAIAPKKAVENLHETANAAAKFHQSWGDAMKPVTDTAQQATASMKSSEEQIREWEEELAKARAEAEKLKEATAKATPKATPEPPKELTDAEREARREAWIGKGARNEPDRFGRYGVKDYEATSSTRHQQAKVRDSFQAYMQNAQAAQQATSANSALASVLQRVQSAFAGTATSANSASSSISRLAPNSASSAIASFGDRLKRIPWGVAHAGANLFKKTISGVGQATKFTGGFIRGFMGTIARVPAGFLRGMANLATFGLIGKGAKEGQSAIDGLTSSVGFGLKGIMKYVLGFRTLFYLARAIRKAVAEGLINLASVDERTNDSLTKLRSGLIQIKNGLATAFAPVINAVTPALTYLINILMDGINAVAQFFAALTGQSTWQKAIYKAEDFSAAMDKSGNSAQGANDKAKELKKTLLSFDKINRLDDNDSSSGSGGGGGGGGGGAAGAGMFSTETVSTGISDFANMVKEAWKNADFYEVGQVVGEKLRDALEHIPWDEKIKPAAEKVGKSLGTFITGFVETPGLPEAIGKAVAEAMNTAMTGVNAFASSTNWQSVGEFVSKTIGSVLDNFDYELAGETASNLMIAVQDYVAGCISGVDWKGFPSKVVEKVKEFLGGIKWKEELASLGNLAGTALKAVFDFSKGIAEVVGGAWSKIKKKFLDEFEASGISSDASLSEKGKAILNAVLKGFIFPGTEWIYQNILKPFLESFASALTGHKVELADNGEDFIEGIFNGIKNWITNVGKWIKTNIFDKFVNGFKEIFGIHSPASDDTIVGLGSSLIEGVFDGIINWMGNIKTWLKEHVFDAITKAWDGLVGENGLLDKLGEGLLGGGVNEPTKTITIDAKKGPAWDGVAREYHEVKDGTATKTAEGKKGSLWDTIVNGWNSIFDSSAKKEVDASKGKDWDSTVKEWDSFTGGTKTATVNATANFTEKKTGFSTTWDSKANFTSRDRDKKKFSTIWDSIAKFVKRDRDKKKFSTSWDLTGRFISRTRDKNKFSTSWDSTARFTHVSDGLSSSQKTIKTTAKVTSMDTSGLSGMMKFKVERQMIGAIGGAMANGYFANNIPQYAVGGSPSRGSVFIAGESGAEVVGHLNGRTEVLNRSQMAAVMYSAVLRGMSQALATSGNNQQVVVIEPNAQGIFRVVQKEANNYTNMTGRPAFNM